MSLAHSLTKQMGGDWNGHYGLVPGPGHSARDRSLKVSAHDTDPDDVIVHSFAGDDALAIKADWRARGLLPRRSDADRPIDHNAIRKRSEERERRQAGESVKRQTTARYLWEKSRPA